MTNAIKVLLQRQGGFLQLESTIFAKIFHLLEGFYGLQYTRKSKTPPTKIVIC
jgi:hypothetical protein